MNLTNQQLQSIKHSKEHIKLQIKNTYDIKTLITLNKKLKQLNKEETKILKQIGVQ